MTRMIRVRVELWMWMGGELGTDFHSPSDMRSVVEVQAEEGITVRGLLADLAHRYRAIEEKIFDKDKGRLHGNVVMTLNERVVGPLRAYERVLEDGDKITILPIHAGG